MQFDCYLAHLRETEKEYVLSIDWSDKELARRIPGRWWDGKRRSWIYPHTPQVYTAIKDAFRDRLVDHTTLPSTLGRRTPQGWIRSGHASEETARRRSVENATCSPDSAIEPAGTALPESSGYRPKDVQCLTPSGKRPDDPVADAQTPEMPVQPLAHEELMAQANLTIKQLREEASVARHERDTYKNIAKIAEQASNRPDIHELEYLRSENRRLHDLVRAREGGKEVALITQEELNALKNKLGILQVENTTLEGQLHEQSAQVQLLASQLRASGKESLDDDAIQTRDEEVDRLTKMLGLFQSKLSDEVALNAQLTRDIQKAATFERVEYLIRLASRAAGDSPSFRELAFSKRITAELIQSLDDALMQYLRRYQPDAASEMASDALIDHALKIGVLTREQGQLVGTVRDQRCRLSEVGLKSSQRMAAYTIALFAAASLWGSLDPAP